MSTPFAKLIAFIKLGRYIFAGSSFMLVAFGALLAHESGASIDWGIHAWGQAIVTLTQLMTHYGNDYFDYAADRANHTPTYWSGGSRVLVRGDLSPVVARNTAYGLGCAALLLTGLLAVFSSVGADAIGVLLLGISLSWFYSAPPLRLVAHSLGEVAATFVVVILTPLVGYTLQTDTFQIPVLLALCPLIPLQINMLLSVHLPDVEGDLAVGKITLVARLGRKSTATLYTRLLILTYALLPILVVLGIPLAAAIGALIPLPLAVYLYWRMRRGDWQHSAQRNSLAFQSIGLLMATLFGELALVWFL